MDAHARRRAVYLHKAAKAQEACGPLNTLALMLYATVLGFLLAGRLGVFSLLIPTPTIPGAPPSPAGKLHGHLDLWDPSDSGAVVRITLGYILVIVVHMLAAFRLIVKGIPGSWNIKPMFVWIAPMVLWLASSVFCFYYATLARYRASLSEWIAATCVSVIIAVATLFMLHCRGSISHYLSEEDDPEDPAP